MTTFRRLSPIHFTGQPVRTDIRDNWTVVLEYGNEGDGPWLVDLSHRPRWDIQSRHLDRFQSGGFIIPHTVNTSRLENGILVNRMNGTQAAVWHLAGETPPMPDDPAFTEMTDATLFLALLGKEIFSITEKLSSLDFQAPERTPPFLFQGPFSHVPCQMVTLHREPSGSVMLFTCSRGYGRDMVHALLDAGAEWGLKPAGEKRFTDWLDSISAGQTDR